MFSHCRFFLIFAAASSTVAENPYSPIIKRNAFNLTSETTKPILPPVSEILAPDIFLTGITRHGKIKKAHLVLKGKSSMPSHFLSLSKGGKKYDVELLKIERDSVLVVNSGIKQLLTFKDNSLPTVVLKVPSVGRSSSSKREKDPKSSSKSSKSKTPTPPTPRPQIVRVPSRKPQIDPRIIEKGLEYLGKTDNDEKREHVLKRLESLQSGQSHIKSDIDQNERRRQYDEWIKRKN
jgi:hypothetical protein